MLLYREGNNNTFINTLYVLLNFDRRFQLMAERNLQKCRHTPVTRTPSNRQDNSTTDEKFGRKILQLPTVIVPDMKSDYLNSYKETGIGLSKRDGIAFCPLCFLHISIQ